MATKMKPHLATQTRLVEDFNRANTVGVLVRYWRGAKDGPPSGVGETTSEAQLLSGHTAVVWIKGCSGCIGLSHVEVV